MCALPMQSCFVPLCMHPAEQPWVKSRNMKKEELTLLKSREVIAINQDPLGIAGDRVWKQGPYEVILPASVPYAYRDSLSEIAQSSDQGMRLPVRRGGLNLWKGQTLCTADGSSSGVCLMAEAAETLPWMPRLCLIQVWAALGRG